MAPSVAEIKLVALRNCFANIPQSLTNILSNANAVSLGYDIIAIETDRHRSFKMLSLSSRPEMRPHRLPRSLPSVQMVIHNVPSTSGGRGWQAHQRELLPLNGAEDVTEKTSELLR